LFRKFIYKIEFYSHGTSFPIKKVILSFYFFININNRFRYFYLTGKIDKKSVTILSEIDRITDKLQLPYFIVGATARDILLQHAHDIHSTRATVDIDIGVLVSDWNQFQALKQALVGTGKFNSTRQTQRLMYGDEFPVDIVPFGGIAQGEDSISWPPDYENEMSIAGFRECYQHAISVIASKKPELVVKVVSLAGLAIMKIVSWDDSSERRGKDAADLFIIIRNYIAAGNVDRFFQEEGDILREEDSDYDLSSAHFWGERLETCKPGYEREAGQYFREGGRFIEGA